MAVIVWEKGGCLFIATFNAYVCAFKQSALYKAYLNGRRCEKGHDKDELQLQQAANMVTYCKCAIAKYTNGSSITIGTPHLHHKLSKSWIRNGNHVTLIHS